MPRSPRPVSYVVLLPVKPPGRGKSRLGDLPRDVLAAAFAMDTATACLATPSVGQVLVVTDDASFAGTLSTLGCASIPDGVSHDLNASGNYVAANPLHSVAIGSGQALEEFDALLKGGLFRGQDH